MNKNRLESVVKQGLIAFSGFDTWYQVIGQQGDPSRLPILTLHGGPGASHDYLEPLAELANSGRLVIFYDQLGCGNSDQPHNPSMWSLGLYLDELRRVREALGLETFHLYGQSWGGILAMEYALTKPGGIASLIISSTPASVPVCLREMDSLISQLPPEIRAAIRNHDQSNMTSDAAYTEACFEFYRRHVCRLDPWPECLNRTAEKWQKNPEVYNTMWGNSEFSCTGKLKDWDITERLPDICEPTLILCGRHDEVTPTAVETLHKRIPNSEWVIFENSSHMPHLEEPTLHTQTVERFLGQVEGMK